MERYEILKSLIDANQYKKIAEIGVMAGGTALYLLQNCLLDSYIAVDKSFNNLLNTLNKINFPNLQLIEKESWEASKLTEDRSLDLVFIDADHAYEAVLKDIVVWLPKIKRGGMICGHDYEYDNIRWGVKKAVDELFPDRKLIKDSLNEHIYIWYVNV